MEKSSQTKVPRLFPSTRRSTTLTSFSTFHVLGAFLFASVIFFVPYIYSLRAVAIRNSLCLQGRSQELADQARCGDKALLENCLHNIQADSNDIILAEIEECFVNAGCEPGEARIETGWVWTRRCYDSERKENDDDDTLVDGALRKRQAGGATSPKAPGTATANPRTNTATAESASSASVETVVVTASDSTTTAAAATTTTGNPTTGRPSVCFTTSMVDITTCPIETTGARSGKPGSCFPTTAPTSVCAAGLICHTDSQGSPSCMYANNNFGTAGIIIALFFAIAVTAAICLLVFLCCRDRREQNRLTKAAEAAAIARDAKNAAVVKKRPSVKVRSLGAEEDEEDDGTRPLMAQQRQQQQQQHHHHPDAPRGRGRGLDEGMYDHPDAVHRHGNDEGMYGGHPQVHGYGGHADGGGMEDPFADQNRIR